MADEAKEAFLVEGIRRYAQALDTIDAFRRMLGDRLREVAKAYSSKVFTPSTATPNSGNSDYKERAQHIVWLYQKGTLQGVEGDAWLDLGVWWRDDEVAYYCGFLDANDKTLPFTYTGNQSGVESKKWSSNDAYLFMLAGPDPGVGLDDKFKILLDELTATFA